VLDGVGIGRKDAGDAVHLARTPTLDWLSASAPYTTLSAHGTHVGMPSDADMGNSEVGHNALGSGKIYCQGATRVHDAITTGALFDDAGDDSETWRALLGHVREHKSTLHLIGLLSDGNVHAHINHVEAMVREAHRAGVTRTRLHAMLDGRDVGGQTSDQFVAQIEIVFAELNADGGDHRIASGGGRMLVTMDRYQAEWDMVERGWRTHVQGVGEQVASATDAILAARAVKPDLNDQYVPAFVVAEGGEPVGRIIDGDAVCLFNFRGDRAIELSRAFEQHEFPFFDRGARPDVFFVGMMQYDGDAGIPEHSLVRPSKISGTMGERLADAGVKQLAVSETQKFGHVTYFWNGNRNEKFAPDLETYIEVPSDRVTFDQRPWMKAAEITDAVITALDEDPEIRFIRVNYPNGDMVGHTGDLEAAILAVEASDLSLRRLLEALRERDGAAIVTADHGNADQMFQLDKKTGEVVRSPSGVPVPMTAHTLNPVPLWVYAPSLDADVRITEMPTRRLSNVANTALELLGFESAEALDPSLITVSKKTSA
jgi:2,3-bisphosphoglycerate-independent phosphoglycerate mutase